MTTFQHLMKKQWPFWLGGLVVGISEMLYFTFTGLGAGGSEHADFINVTSGFAQMYASIEQFFSPDYVGRVYEPNIHWTIIGALAGARLVGILEKDVRSWVRYNWRMIALAFVGGMLFSFGTRLALGCTTHHFMGGLPAMSLPSWVVLFSGIPFAFLAFKLSLKLELGGHFRHQETKPVAQLVHDSDSHHNPGYDPNYNPLTDPLRIVLNTILILFLAVPLYFAIFGDDYASSISNLGFWGMMGFLIPGLVLGFGIAKSGFGTECSVMAPESVFIDKDKYCNAGMPVCTFRMFRSMAPLQGFMVAIVSFNIFLMIAWLVFDVEMPTASASGLHWGHVVGGPFLAMGAVFMIGCEVRTYARLGLGYMTALAALPGFFIGYIPYTLNKEAIDEALLENIITEYQFIPEAIADTIGGTEIFWAFIYSAFLIGLLVMSFVVGRRFFKTTMSEMLKKNTDELVYPEVKCEALLPNTAK